MNTKKGSPKFDYNEYEGAYWKNTDNDKFYRYNGISWVKVSLLGSIIISIIEFLYKCLNKIF